MLLLSATAFAQGPPSPGMMPPPGPGRDFVYFQRGGPGPEHGPMGPMGRWWKNSEVVKKVGVSDEQVQKIEHVFQDHRLKLIDVRAALEKEEVKLQPMIEADSPNDQQIMAQIDRVANARAQLEKANAQMLLDIRHILTLDQWKKLQSMPPIHMRVGHVEGMRGEHGPGPSGDAEGPVHAGPGDDGVVTGGPGMAPPPGDGAAKE
jgi:Spy/CpxP family protein refolding chaperone